MADSQAIRLLESIYARVDKQVRDIVMSMLKDPAVAAQDDGSVVANRWNILNFQGAGVTLVEEPARRRVNILVPGSPTASSSVIAQSSGSGIKSLSLWTGSTNNSPPAGWTTIGYNDSSWTTPAVPGAGGLGGAAIWPSSTPLSTTEQALFRHAFTIPAGSQIVSATLSFQVNDAMVGIWLNDTFIAGSTFTGTAGTTVNLTIPQSQPVVGTNVLAIHARNILLASNPGDAYVRYSLTVTTNVGGVDTQYELVANKNVANGYAGLDSNVRVPTARLGSGTADSTTYLRGDQSWATPAGGGGSGGGDKLLLDWSASTDIAGSAITAATWTDTFAAQSFTVDDASAIVEIAVSGCLRVGGGTTIASVASRLNIDSNAQTKKLGMARMAAAGDRPNSLSGAGPAAVSGLSAASHTVKVQVYLETGTGTTDIYCRANTLPNIEFLSIRVWQRGT